MLNTTVNYSFFIISQGYTNSYKLQEKPRWCMQAEYLCY